MRLYRDALESVFGFLSLADLSRVLAVSRAWSAAVRSMKPIDAEVTSEGVSAWMIAASPLAVHVRHFGSTDYYWKNSSGDLLFLSRPPFSLISLACALDLSPPARMFLGHSLQSLTLQLRDEANTAAVINEAFVTISRLPLLEKLDLWLSSFFPEVSFAPFAVAPRLRIFRCKALFVRQPTHPQLDHLRMIPHLRSVDLALSRESLLFLLRAPHSLEWQEINRVDDIDSDVAAALSTLPTLTTLATLACCSVAFLPALTRLRSLVLDLDPDVLLAADIVAGLPCCSQLTDLALSAADVTSAHLSEALPHLPQQRIR